MTLESVSYLGMMTIAGALLGEALVQGSDLTIAFTIGVMAMLVTLMRRPHLLRT